MGQKAIYKINRFIIFQNTEKFVFWNKYIAFTEHKILNLKYILFPDFLKLKIYIYNLFKYSILNVKYKILDDIYSLICLPCYLIFNPYINTIEF